jgi:gliding motility-associated-like protein
MKQLKKICETRLTRFVFMLFAVLSFNAISPANAQTFISTPAGYNTLQPLIATNGYVYFVGATTAKPLTWSVFEIDTFGNLTQLPSDPNIEIEDPVKVTVINGDIYFTSGTGLWRISTTNNYVSNAYPGQNLQGITIVSTGNKIFIPVTGASGGVWVYNTDDGTISQLNPPHVTLSTSTNGEFIAFNNEVYFLSAPGGSSSYYNVIQTDGTSGGTSLVSTISNANYNISSYIPLTLNGKIIFDGGGYYYSFTPVTQPGDYPSTPIGEGDYSSFTPYNNRIYANSSTGLYYYDGITSSFQNCSSIAVPGFSNLPNTSCAVYNGKMYGKYDDPVTGIELWASDGTTGGTHIVKDVFPGSYTTVQNYTIPNSSYPLNPVIYQDIMYFEAADSSSTPDEGNPVFSLWQSDGTSAGTVKVSNIVNIDLPFVISNNIAYVAGSDGTNTGLFEITLPDPTLAGLSISAGSLNTVFSANTLSYTANVSNATTSITVTPITTDPAATVTVNGTPVTSGTASGPVALAVGQNTINTVVTASDGVTKNIYTLTVTRVLSSVATLSKLTISNGTLSPAFAVGTTGYADVAHSVTSIALRAITTDPTATETINGAIVPEGTISPYMPLNAGLNVITVIVTAQDGVTQDTYTIDVTRLPGIATLSKLTVSNGTLSPAFATGTTNYTDVAHSVNSIAFRAITTDPLATETINGTAVPEGTVSPYIPLNIGVNDISVVVTAQDGVTQDTYTIAVTRLPEIASLSKLTVSNGTLTPAFAIGTTSYTDVAKLVNSIAFRAITTDPLATETINGTAVPEGTVSPYIPLNVGLNNITVVVTAQDGVTQETYTIAVTRLPAIATLSKLTVSNGNLTPAFATATTGYTDNVAFPASSIAFRAITTDPLATETINGMAVPEGTVSPYMPLNTGVNTIPVVVTAQDGITQDTYTVAVTLTAPPVANAVYEPVSIEITETNPSLDNDGIVVHLGVSPNGDGIDDFLQIDHIANYPDNRLAIMNRNGILIYEAKGYDNTSRIFDGHSSKGGQMQLPGTYFYRLDYTVNGIIKHKTGFLVLKY